MLVPAHTDRVTADQGGNQTGYAALDPGLAAAIESQTGRILEAAPAPGFSADYTGVIQASGGAVFVKAVRDRPGHQVDALEREAAINPSVLHVSPALLWRASEHGWRVLGFEYIRGPRADFKPGSADLRDVVHTIELIGQTKLPDVARGWPERRWDRYTDNPELFAGTTLLHSDINPGNFIMESDNAAVVDWAWPGHGAAFVDPGCLVVQLISSGHSADEAEDWAASCTGWREAAPAALDEFAAATLRMYQRFKALDPEPWRRAMSAAAWKWNEYRTGSHCDARSS